MSGARDGTTSLLLTGIVGFIAGGAVAYQVLQTRRRKQPDDPATLVEQVIVQRRTVQAAYFVDPNDTNNDKAAVVSRAQIERLLHAANWAPTHGKTEPWRFVIFETLAARRALGEADAAIYKSMTPPESFAERKYQKKINAKVQSSHFISQANR